MKKILLFATLALSVSINLNAQELTKEDKKELKNADLFLAQKDYIRALKNYEYLAKKYPQSGAIKYKAGVAATHVSGKGKDAVEYLESCKSIMQNHTYFYWHLGNAYHKNYEFKKAIEALRKYMNNVYLSEEEIKKALTTLKYCENGLKITNEEEKAQIINLGPKVNTSGDEYVPVLTLDESLLLFTYKGNKSRGGLLNSKMKPVEPGSPDGMYFEDIYYTNKENDGWATPKDVEALNTNDHDAAIAISPDGTSMYIYKFQMGVGNIYESKYSNGTWSTPTPLKGEVNTAAWEGSCSISLDGKQLYFCSTRPGGIGERDLYVANMLSDGSWGNVQNLGANINTILNEDAPFIDPSGTKLYFSSESHSSIGGYDIFFSDYKDGVWQKPENVGYPINSPEDDRYFVVTKSGTGYFSSSRPDGYGGEDLYKVILKGRPYLLITGNCLLDRNSTAGATIKVLNKSTKEEVPVFQDEATGNYSIMLEPEQTYNLVVSTDKNFIIEEFSTGEFNDQNIMVHNFEFFSEDYRKSQGISQPSNASHLAKNIEDWEKAKQDEDPNAHYRVIVSNKNDIDALDKESLMSKYKKVDEIYDAKGQKIVSIGNFDTHEKAKALETTLAGSASTIFIFDGYKNKTITGFNDNTDEVDLGESTMFCDPSPTDFSSMIGKDMKNGKNFAQLLSIGGDFCKEGLKYKVQIGAYHQPNKWRRRYSRKFGEAEETVSRDNVFRYTLGEFDTMIEAEAYRQTIMDTFNDAWIIGFFHGDRVVLEDLVARNFYQ